MSHNDLSLNSARSGMRRRDFLRTSAGLVLTTCLSGCTSLTSGSSPGSIIDIHQHLGYSGRPDSVLLDHQRLMGIGTTILLPAGRPVKRPSTNDGASNGLEAKCMGNEACYQFARAYPGRFYFGANEVPDVLGAAEEIEKYLKLGAVVIGEQKFSVPCDCPEMQRIYELGAEYRAPILMHWQYKRFNHGFERFHKMLQKYPKTTFIGHAQTWWAHIDAAYRDDPANLYPRTPVSPGGLTDRYLRDYPNMYGDLSAGSGLNAITRDEIRGREFLLRHQDKLIYGSDCNDLTGEGDKCQGSQMIAEIRRLVPEAKVQRKLFYGNAKHLFRW